MAEAEKKQGVRTVKGGDIKPPWEVREMPAPPPLDFKGLMKLKKFHSWLKMNMVTLAVFFVILGGIWFTYFASLAGYSAAVIYKMEVPGGIKIATILAVVLFIYFLAWTIYDNPLGIKL